jgi:eukaryotic-like serine/threonine-protein kinase
MTDDGTCPECQRPLPADAREEVCPTCALESLLKFVTEDSSVLAPGSGIAQPSTLNGQLSTRFGDYELLELLARGGMGVVYKARQISLNRTVALKMIQAGVLATPAEVKRFHTEAEAIAQLHHPNIVAVYEIGEYENQHYFSMEYVVGRTLGEIVRDGPLPATRAATYVRTVAAAVHYAHQHGILHRDLKPANIIIDENDQPRITDFGLAKRFIETTGQGAGTTDLTLSGQVLGSPNYLPPEQAEPKRGVLGPPSDVYALGAILYHLVTGRPPFQAESLTTLLREVIETDPVTPRSLNPGIPRDLETICLKCLEKEPLRRYNSAQALEEDLDCFLNSEPVLARPIGAAGRVWRWCRRRPIRASLGAAFLVVLALGVSGISWQWRRAERERRTALANEQLTLRQAYAGDMNWAQRSLEQGDLGRARNLLAKYRTGPGSKSKVQNPKSPAELRGWEWRYLWGLCRSDEHTKIAQRFPNSIWNLVLSPDGTLLGVCHDGGGIELWDLAGRRLATTVTNRGECRAVAFSSDGRLLAFADRDREDRSVVRFWDVLNRRAAWDLPQPSPVTSLALSPDGKWLATVHVNTELRFRLWEIPSGKLTMELPATTLYNGMLPLSLFSPDGTVLARGETQGQIHLLNLTTGVTNEIPSLREGLGVYTMAFSPDGRILAAGYGWTHNAIHLWDVATGRPLGTLEGHQGPPFKLVFSPDGQTLYSASSDQSLGIWDLGQRKQIRRLQGHTDGVTGLVLSPDGRTLVSCAQDGSVRVWDLRAKARPPAERTLPVRTGPYGVVFGADHHLITASPTDSVTVWDVLAAKESERIPALGINNQSVAVSLNKGLLAVGTLDGKVKIWHLQRRCLLGQWQAHRFPIIALQFLDGGRSLLSAAVTPDLNNELKRWEVGSWRELSMSPADLGMCWGLAQSPDQRLLVLTYGAKPVKVWNNASGRLEAALGSEGGFCPRFSHDGRLIAAALRYRARVWEVGSWRQVAEIEQRASGTYSVAFSPDDQRLVTGSLVGENVQSAVSIWDYTVERELLTLKAEDSWVPWTAWTDFSPDGNSLLAVSWSGAVKLWHAPSWAEIEAEEKAEGKRERETGRP